MKPVVDEPVSLDVCSENFDGPLFEKEVFLWKNCSLGVGCEPITGCSPCFVHEFPTCTNPDATHSGVCAPRPDLVGCRSAKHPIVTISILCTIVASKLQCHHLIFPTLVHSPSLFLIHTYELVQLFSSSHPNCDLLSAVF